MMKGPNVSSSSSSSPPRCVPPSPDAIAFKFTDDSDHNDNNNISPNRRNLNNRNGIIKGGVSISPKTTRVGANTNNMTATAASDDIIHPNPTNQVININIPTISSSSFNTTDSPSMVTNVSELSHNSSSLLRTPPTNHTLTTSNTKKPLNSTQQAAMNNFLGAKSKEDKARAWEELVRSLKQSNRRGGGGGSSVDSRGRRKHHHHQRQRTGSFGSVGSCGSHSLGFIQYSNVKQLGGMSVTSGLTSNGTVDITQYYVGGRGGGGGVNQGGSSGAGGGGGEGYDGTALSGSPPLGSGGGDHKPPLFPVITTTTTNTSTAKEVIGGGGQGVDELVSPLSDNEYYDDDYDDTSEQEEHEQENGVSNALLNVDDAEEELAVYEDEEEEDVSALKGVTLFDSMTSIQVDEDVVAEVVGPPPPPPFATTAMPKLQPPDENNNRQSVRDMIGRYETNDNGVALLEEEDESESWSPSMIRRKNDQLFSNPEQQQQEQPQQQRKEYQFYPEWQKESVESSHDAVVTTTTTAAAAAPKIEVTPALAAAATTIEAPTQRSRKPKKKRFINGAGNGNNKTSSLEHQIRLVLGNSSNDHDVSKDEGPSDNASASDILRELNDSKDEGQSSDNASPSDILRELNSSKEQQQQQPLRSSPNGGNRLPPSSISFGSKSKQQKQQRVSKQSSVATTNGVNSKKTPALLAPSRRDLHSLRIRQMVSKSSMMTNDNVVDDGAAVKYTTATTFIATTSTTTTTNTTTTRESLVRPVRGGKGFFTRTGPSNPSTGLYSSDMITRDEIPNKNFDLYLGRPSNDNVQPTAPQETYASPPRGGTVTPEKPGSPTSSLAESINELKASISELKNAGVGGVGKSTSTLVWNESTGRYVIRDVDDESFDDMVSKGPTVTQDSDNEDEEEEEEEEEDSSFMFKMPNHITRGSILDDDVVDEAVRLAAMDGMSSASTSVGAASGDESLNNFLSSPGEEEDDFFVVERSSNQNITADENKWRAFQQSSSENDAFQLNSWGNNGDDGFGDDFGDDASSPSEIQWGANDWTDWEVDDAAGKQFDKRNNNFVSPASTVPSSNRHEPFNPFAQIVLQSLD